MKKHSAYTTTHCPHCEGTGRVPDWAAIGKLWRKSRRDRDLTQGQIAKALGVSVAYISMLEKGKKPWPARMEFRYLAALKAY